MGVVCVYCWFLRVSLCVCVLLVSVTTEGGSTMGRHWIMEGGGKVCPGDQQTRIVLDEMDMEVRGVVRDIILPRIGSCKPSDITQ